MANYLEQLGGIGGGVNRITATAFNLAAADWEVEVTFRVPAGTTGEIHLLGEASTSNNRFYVNFTTGVLSFRSAGTSYNSAASGITAGSVHTVRYSRVGTVTRFHLNGVQVTQLGYTVSMATAFTNIGGYATVSSRLDLYRLRVTSASVNRDWNADGITSGTVLFDDVGSSDATLTNFAGNPWKTEPTILTLTDPMVAGAAFSGTSEGYDDGAATLSSGAISVGVTIAAGAFSGNLPTIVDGIAYPFMPAVGAVWTLTQSAKTTTLARDLNLPSGYDVTRTIVGGVSNFAEILTAPDTLQSEFVAASNALTTSDRGYFPTAGGIEVYSDSRVSAATLPLAETIWIHRASGNIYFHDVSLTESGVVIIPPTMPADTSVAVDAGVTTLGTFAASATGGEAVTYTLGGTDAALFAINSSSGLVTFVSPAVEGSASITVTATNSAGSDSQAISVTINAVAPVEAVEGYMGIGIRIGLGI